MSEIKLLPCPFCGNDNIDFWDTENEDFPYQIVCLGCFNGTDECVTKEVAIKRWNTRKPTERIVERLEEKRDESMYQHKFDDYFDGIIDSITIVRGEGGIE